MAQYSNCFLELAMIYRVYYQDVKSRDYARQQLKKLGLNPLVEPLALVFGEDEFWPAIEFVRSKEVDYIQDNVF